MDLTWCIPPIWRNNDDDAVDSGYSVFYPHVWGHPIPNIPDIQAMCAVVFEVPGGPGDQAGIGCRLVSRICFHDQALILESDKNYLLLWDALGHFGMSGCIWAGGSFFIRIIQEFTWETNCHPRPPAKSQRRGSRSYWVEWFRRLPIHAQLRYGGLPTEDVNCTQISCWMPLVVSSINQPFA